MVAITTLKEYFTELEHLLSETRDDKDLFEVIVNAPFHNKLHTTNLDLGIVALLLVDKKNDTIDRVTFSDTEPARWAAKMTPMPFNKIKVPRDSKQNIVAKAIRLKQYQSTTDWKYLFTPVLTAEAARFNQAGAGIACSYIYPLIGAKDGGALIFSFYQPPENINIKHRNFMQKYSDLVVKALQAPRKNS